MGKLASSERSGGDGGGDPPDRLAGAALPPAAHPRPPPATTPRTPVAGSHPAPRARPHLAGERSAGAQLRAGASRRPGCSFQDRLLRDFYSTAVPGAVAPSSPAPLWATPGSSSVRYNLAFVTNMLNYLLTVCPGRLSVSRVRPKVFRFVIANRNIAHVLAVRGWLCLGTSVLYLLIPWREPSARLRRLKTSAVLPMLQLRRTGQRRLMGHRPCRPRLSTSPSCASTSSKPSPAGPKPTTSAASRTQPPCWAGSQSASACCTLCGLQMRTAATT